MDMHAIWWRPGAGREEPNSALSLVRRRETSLGYKTRCLIWWYRGNVLRSKRKSLKSMVPVIPENLGFPYYAVVGIWLESVGGML